MVVKKFEARSMKEALDMIKSELGPEAIILAARDNSERYGLVGEGSVEITAAIQEMSLKKKQLVESRLPAALVEKVHRGSAKSHKTLIERSHQQSLHKNEVQKQVAAPSSNHQTSKPKSPVERGVKYIDMMDDIEPNAAPNGANDKLKIAAQKAWKNIQQSTQQNNVNAPPINPPSQNSSLNEIKSDLDSIKKFFTSIQSVPQNVVQGHPGMEYGLRYELSDYFDKLISSGVSEMLTVEILKHVQDILPDSKQVKSSALITGMLVQALAKKIQISNFVSTQKIEVFIGAGGHGKTSTLVKRAAQLVLRDQKRIAILSTDTQKLGANEQLKIYSQILNIPFMSITNAKDWEMLEDELNNFDSVLVDSPGVRFRVTDEIQNLKKILPPSYLGTTTHLVISATAKDQDAIEIGKRFSTVGFDDLIFTALDESTQHGVILNFQAFAGKPIHSFGIGPQIPEDYELATKERVIDLLLGVYTSSPVNLNIAL